MQAETSWICLSPINLSVLQQYVTSLASLHNRRFQESHIVYRWVNLFWHVSKKQGRFCKNIWPCFTTVTVLCVFDFSHNSRAKTCGRMRTTKGWVSLDGKSSETWDLICLNNMLSLPYLLSQCPSTVLSYQRTLTEHNKKWHNFKCLLRNYFSYIYFLLVHALIFTSL